MGAKYDSDWLVHTNVIVEIFARTVIHEDKGY